MIKIIKDDRGSREEIFSVSEKKVDVSLIVKEIIEKVKAEGDSALKFYAEKFDKAVLKSLAVTEEEIKAAKEQVEPEFLAVIERAAKNIREFHQNQKRQGFSFQPSNGVTVGQKIIPIERAGLYVPGGTAAYPSTVLMDAIPAKIAGCEQVVMVTPPDKNGNINPVILAAAAVAGVDKIYKVGGAQV